MPEFNVPAYAAAKRFVEETLVGLGAVKGSPCTIKSITESENGSTIVFTWTGADGGEQTSSTFLPRGPRGIQGEPGPKGEDGSGVDTEARKQIAALTEELKGEGEKEPVTYIANLPGTFTVSTNSILEGDGYGFHTDYIPLDGYTHISAQYKVINTVYALAFFDAAQNLIPDLSIIGEGTDKFYVIDMDVPAGAAYCMMSDYKWGATQGTGSITISGGSAKKDAGLTSKQIAALNEMFKVCAYASSAETAYAAFCTAFGITGGGTGGDSGEGSDGVNVYFADYSEWPKWGSGISVVDNGFSVNSPETNYSAGVAVGIFQSGRYGDYKDKTLKISCDIEGEITEIGEGIPLSLATYSDIPVTGHNEYSTAINYILPYTIEEPRHVEVTLKPSAIHWSSGTPKDTDYIAVKFYCHLVGNVTIANFRVEVV